MTEQEAYAEGFCKAAEAMGVSPRSLARRMAVKEAAPAWVGKAIGLPGRAWRRYVDLWRGTTARKLNDRCGAMYAKLKAADRKALKEGTNIFRADHPDHHLIADHSAAVDDFFREDLKQIVTRSGTYVAGSLPVVGILHALMAKQDRSHSGK